MAAPQANSLDLQNRISSSFGRPLMSQANPQDLRAESASPFGRLLMSRANSQDLGAENLSHQLKSVKSGSGTDTFSSGREFSEQANSSELFYPTQKLELPEFENGSTFQKYVSQRPIFLNPGKYMREQFARPLSNGEGNTDVRGQSRLAYDMNLISPLCEMVKNLSAQVKELQERLDNHVKMSSDARQKRDDEAYELTEKLDTFLSSYKKHKDLVNEMQLKIVKCCETLNDGLKDAEKSISESSTKILKEIGNISEDLVNLQRKLMERTESMQGAFEGVTRKQMKNVCDELSTLFSEKCNETERKNVEQIQDLKSFLKLSLQPLTEKMYHKSEVQEPSTTCGNSENETVLDFCSPNGNTVDQTPVSTRRLRRRKPKSADILSHNGLPSMSLPDQLQKSKDSILRVKNHFITRASGSKNKLRSNMAATSRACNTSNKNTSNTSNKNTSNTSNKNISVNSPSLLNCTKMKRIRKSKENVFRAENPFITEASNSNDKLKTPTAVTSGTRKTTNRKIFPNFSSPPKCSSMKRKQGHKEHSFVQGINHAHAPKHLERRIAVPSYLSSYQRSCVMWNSPKNMSTNLANDSEDDEDAFSQCSTDSSSSIYIHELPFNKKAMDTCPTVRGVKPIQLVTPSKSFQRVKSPSVDDIWA